MDCIVIYSDSTYDNLKADRERGSNGYTGIADSERGSHGYTGIADDTIAEYLEII